MENEATVSSALHAEFPRGMYPGRLDDKGRLKLPTVFAQFFNSLPESKLFLTSLDRRIAQLYPIAEWRANESFFNNFRANPAAARNILFNAQDLGADVEMDGQGRVLVHPDLRRDLKMEGQELHLMAVKGRLEILTDELYQERKLEALKQTAQDLEILEMEGLR